MSQRHPLPRAPHSPPLRSLRLGPFATMGVGVAAVLTLSSLAPGCSDDETTATATSGGSCAPSDPACPALSVDSDCLALVDNEGSDTFTLRMSQLTIQRPTALTTVLVQNLVSDGVNINLDSCGVSGTGAFSWLIAFDRTAGTIRTGGGLPVEDPTGGYCFEVDGANGVEPVTINSNLQDDGSFETDVIEKIIVAVYSDRSATQAVYLPLEQARLVAGTLSADQNCIGRFNADGLEPVNLCKPDRSAGIDYYVDGAELQGFIELEAADAIVVEQLNQTLCVLLSGNVSEFGEVVEGQPTRCTRDGEGAIVFEGDWCKATDSADGCKDAMRLTASVAASSVELRADCP